MLTTVDDVHRRLGLGRTWGIHHLPGSSEEAPGGLGPELGSRGAHGLVPGFPCRTDGVGTRTEQVGTGVRACAWGAAGDLWAAVHVAEPRGIWPRLVLTCWRGH